MQQPAPQQTELDKSEGQVPLNQPIMAMPATDQPVMAAPATGQPIMYQTLPGQPQPMFVQAAPGQPAMSPQGQPVMAAPQPGQPAMVVPHPGQPFMAAPATSQPIMHQTFLGQPQPMLVQAAPGQYAMSPQGQPIQHYISVGGQPVQQGQQVPLVQPVQVQGVPGQHQPLQNPEMFSLLVAGICIIIYSNTTFNTDGRANFFKGTTIFCWVMVIIFQIIYMFGINKSKNCFGKPSNFTIMAIAFQVLLTILLISCTGSLTVRAGQFSDLFKIKYNPSSYGSKIIEEQKINAYLIYTSTAFGYLACLDFLFDIYCLVIMYQRERTQEAGGGTLQPAQHPGIVLQQQIGVAVQPPILPQVTQ